MSEPGSPSSRPAVSSELEAPSEPEEGDVREGAEELAANAPPPDDDASPGDDRGASAVAPGADRALVVSSGDARSLVPLDPLRAYFAEISRYPLLSRSQEHALAVQVHDKNDPKAAQQLVLANLRLVVKIALEYKRVWTNALDLIQEGNVGLLQAVRRFDPHRGVKLSSYSAYWIRAYILKYLIDNIRTVRIGSSRAERKLFFALNRAKRELEREGFKPEPLLLAERLDVKPEEVVSMEQRLAQSDLSLDAPVGTESGAATLGDFQASSAQSSEDLLSDADLRSTLRAHAETFAETLGERERIILWERLLADEPRTLQEIGEQFSLTRERVRQIEKKLVQSLGDYMRENTVDFEYWSDANSR